MIPSEITANTTVEFAITPDNAKLPSDGYVYIFRIGGAQIVSKNGVGTDNFIAFKLSPADTENHKTGYYPYQIFIEKDDDRWIHAQGQVGISASIGLSGSFDGRTVAERIVDAIDALIEGRATSDQQSYAITSGAGSRSLSRIPILELKEIRKHYAGIVMAERRAKCGDGIFKNHRIAFVCE